MIKKKKNHNHHPGADTEVCSASPEEEAGAREGIFAIPSLTLQSLQLNHGNFSPPCRRRSKPTVDEGWGAQNFNWSPPLPPPHFLPPLLVQGWNAVCGGDLLTSLYKCLCSWKMGNLEGAGADHSKCSCSSLAFDKLCTPNIEILRKEG